MAERAADEADDAIRELEIQLSYAKAETDSIRRITLTEFIAVGLAGLLFGVSFTLLMLATRRRT